MAGFIRVAHRGSSGSCPENTRAAIEKAIAAEADAIELDCRLSKDGHIVIFHDEKLRRTARAKGYVHGKSLSELKKLDVGAWFRRSFKGERILTLEEALDIIDGRADLNLDVKAGKPGASAIELQLLFILSHYDYLERSVVLSFDDHVLRRVRELAPDARTGVLHAKGIKNSPLELAREIGAESIYIQKELATRPILERAAEQGLKTLVWTVNDLREMEKFLALGVDGIVSDYPEKFWKIRQKRK